VFASHHGLKLLKWPRAGLREISVALPYGFPNLGLFSHPL
jgi:hypothetical protein